MTRFRTVTQPVSNTPASNTARLQHSRKDNGVVRFAPTAGGQSATVSSYMSNTLDSR